MSHPTPTSTAPWKLLFDQQLSTLREATGGEFVLATVNKDGLPRVRYCIHRGFFASLPENPHNKLPRNPSIYDSDCPTFTTDSRMNKTLDIFATGKGKGNLEQSRSGTGGGGPVEAVYWIKDLMTQWRVRGSCWLIAADDVEGGEDAAQNSGTVSMKAALGRYMRQTGEHETQDKDWSWKLEVENHFENLSPTMRGSFKNPEPAKPIDDGVHIPGEALGQKGGSLKDEEIARKHFRVAVILPQQVEQLDLSDPSKSKRCVWTLSEGAGGPKKSESNIGKPVHEWNMVETWP